MKDKNIERTQLGGGLQTTITSRYAKRGNTPTITC